MPKIVNAALKTKTKTKTKAKAIGAAAETEAINVWPRGASGQELASRTTSLVNCTFDYTKF